METTAEKAFAANLKELREFHDLTQDHLGDLIGVTGASIGNWERLVVSPSLKSMGMVANALGVRLTSMLEAAILVEDDVLCGECLGQGTVTELSIPEEHIDRDE